MKNSTGKYAASGFRAVKVCLPRRKLAFRWLPLCLGLIFIAGFVLLRQQDGQSDYSVRFTVPVDHLGNKSVEITHQRVEDLCKGLPSEIPCYCKYVKPVISLREVRENTDFQPVKLNTSYVYSAYLDDRVTPDVDYKALPVVRIFTVLHIYDIDQALKNWHCLFWYEMVDPPLVMPVVALTNLDVKDVYHRFLVRMVLCSLPTNLTSSPPSAVSLVSNICESPQNFLPVTDLRERRRNFERSSSNGSSTFFYNDNRVSNFTICVPPIFGDYIKTVEVIEFIELNRLLGADKFVFYLQSPKPELISCLWYYSKLGLVELNSFVLPPFTHESVLLRGQILSQNECLFRVMYRTKYVINQDLDEFIVPTRTTDWTTMLDLIHKNKQYGEGDRLATYTFRNLFFRMQEPNDLSVEEPFRVNGYELKTLTKTLGSDKSDPWKERSKVMGRPERLIIWHCHEIYDSSLVRKGDVNALIDDGDGLLFHYREMDYQRYPNYSGNTTNRRMWMYKRQLFANVASRARSYGCKA